MCPLSITCEAAAAVMTFGSGNAAVQLLVFVVIGAIISVTNAKPPSRIYGGRNAQDGEFKYIVSLSRNRYTHECGGAIIGPRHVITAAHCLQNRTARGILVRSGIVDLDDETAIESSVARLFIHPDYVSSIPGKRQIWNDIAVLELKEDLELGERLMAIPLPTREPKTQRAVFSGWGDLSEKPTIIPTRLQTADVQVIDKDECRKMGVWPKDPQFICGYQQTGHILDGDSGGPLVSRGELIGLASTGFGVQRIPDSYTNVWYYLDWIDSVRSKKHR